MCGLCATRCFLVDFLSSCTYFFEIIIDLSCSRCHGIHRCRQFLKCCRGIGDIIRCSLNLTCHGLSRCGQDIGSALNITDDTLQSLDEEVDTIRDGLEFCIGLRLNTRCEITMSRLDIINNLTQFLTDFLDGLNNSYIA